MEAIAQAAFCGWSRADVSWNGQPWSVRKGALYQEVKTTDLFGACLLKGCRALAVRWFPFGGGCEDWTGHYWHDSKERKDKTTIIVSHRLSAVHQADWLIVLDQGQIVEEGRASDLLAQEGWYYEQYQRQQNRKENKMKVLKRLLSRITLYPTVFLAGFICLFTSHHFFWIVTLSSPKDDRWAFDCIDPRWRQGDLASDGRILSLGLEPGAAD